MGRRETLTKDNDPEIHQEIKNQLRLTAMKKNNIAEVKTVKKNQ